MMMTKTDMDDRQITLNEVLNDGTRIYVYPDPQTGFLLSYGYSAYLLSFVEGLEFIATFSRMMQMPVISFTESGLERLHTAGILSFEWNGKYHTASSPHLLSEDGYRSWTEELRGF